MTPRMPDISAARLLAKARILDGVLIVSFREGSYCIASYGATKAQCAALKKLNIFIGRAIDKKTIDMDAFDSHGCPWPMIVQD